MIKFETREDAQAWTAFAAAVLAGHGIEGWEERHLVAVAARIADALFEEYRKRDSGK